MTADEVLTIVTVVARVLAVVALALLAAGIVASAIGTVLAERARGYRLPYEQSSHVRVLRGDES